MCANQETKVGELIISPDICSAVFPPQNSLTTLDAMPHLNCWIIEKVPSDGCRTVVVDWDWDGIGKE